MCLPSGDQEVEVARSLAGRPRMGFASPPEMDWRLGLLDEEQLAVGRERGDGRDGGVEELFDGGGWFLVGDGVLGL